MYLQDGQIFNIMLIYLLLSYKYTRKFREYFLENSTYSNIFYMITSYKLRLAFLAET